MSTMRDETDPQDVPPGGCCEIAGCTTDRREFLQITAIGAAAGALSSDGTASTQAGPQPIRLIPADKRLDPTWLASLVQKGVPEVFQGADLDRIGMPIGGICAGQVYLGGDGSLWHWDVFNVPIATNDAHYAKPMTRSSPIEQGFAIEWRCAEGSGFRKLGRDWRDVHFRGEYPLGIVGYADPAIPCSVKLTGFSPFVPLETADSSLPATILRFEITNRSANVIEVELAGWLENRIGRLHKDAADMSASQRRKGNAKANFIELTAEPLVRAPASLRPKINFANFDGNDYAGWTPQGTAFGNRPSNGPATVQQLRGWQGKGLVNTWTGSDAPTGRLTSPVFRIERRFINFLLAGGNHPGKTCINLSISGRIVRTTTGRNDDRMRPVSWNVEEFAGREARIEIVDGESGGWGHIDVDAIEFADAPTEAWLPPNQRPDVGSMTLAVVRDHAGNDESGLPTSGMLDRLNEQIRAASAVGRTTGAVSSLAATRTIRPSAVATVDFVIAWHFPNLKLDGLKGEQGRHYATRFASSFDVAAHVVDNLGRLRERTWRWHDTWYESTLPWWFLDRTFLNASILATSTCHRFRDGRFYGWEGVGCCGGTCTHVWQYAQAVARLFPDLERNLREQTDFRTGFGFDAKSAVIAHRGEISSGPAVDGQAGVILRTLREHQMSADDSFLRRLWPQAKRALDWLVQLDGNADGLLEGAQHNTLDAEWFGKVPWLSSLYLAALKAGAQMAIAVGDADHAARLEQIAQRGQANLVRELWRDDYGYFVQRPDPKNLAAVGTFDGCHIDQVFGQSWAFQVGLGRVLDRATTRRALESIWRYNFAPDVGPYRKERQAGRWYAMPGEAGLLMATFPFGQPPEFKNHPSAWSAMYFNECMNGFEYQVAGHMLWEGMVEKGLAIVRAIHDRYRPARRNPYNEVECGDHYARSMASYGVFLAACGFEYDGPRGYMAFAPRLGPDRFRAAFTAAEGWGAISQDREPRRQTNGVEIRHGRLTLRQLAFEIPAKMKPTKIEVTLDGKLLPASFQCDGLRVSIQLAAAATCNEGQRLRAVIQ